MSGDWGGRILRHADRRWILRRHQRAQLRAATMLDAVGADAHERPAFQFSDRQLSESAYLTRLAELQRRPRERRRDPGRLRELAATFEDLANRAGTDPDRKIELTAEASAMWSLAGYQANAVVLATMVRRAVAGDASLSGRFIDLVGALLARQVRDVEALASNALADVPQLGEDLVTDAEGHVDHSDAALLAVYGLVARAGAAAATFWRTGSPAASAESLATMTRAAQVALDACLVDTWLLADNLRMVLGDSFAMSTWRQLRGRAPNWNALWRRHLSQLANAAPPVLELWPSQLRALDAGFINNDGAGLAVTMPTSAGKSHLAEFAILAALASCPGEQIVAVVVPSRALAAETERRLADSLGRIGLRVSALFGGFDHSDYEGSVVAQSDVLVATAEKIDLLLRQEPDIADRLALIIIDEAHLVDDEHRGINFELLVSRLRRRAPSARLVMLSAVLPNLNDFGAWLDATAEGSNTVESDWTPSRLQMGVFYWHPADEEGTTGRVEYQPQAELESEYFLPYILERRRARTKLHPDGNAATAAALALHYVHLGPVLIGSATKERGAEAVSRQLGRVFANRARQGDPIDLVNNADRVALGQLARDVEDFAGPGHPLCEYIRQGFAYHHADVPEVIRLGIENAYRKGHLKILCATSTLSQGVNLPTRTVIVAHTNRGQNQRMSVREFRNLAGRAGRAFNETDGHVILVAMDRIKAGALRRRYLEADMEPVQSWLFRLYVLLAQLRLERPRAAARTVLPLVSADLLFDDEDLPEELSLHPVFTRLDVQLLALLAEEVIDTEDEAAIEELLGTTLCAVQLADYDAPLQPLVGYLRRRAGAIAQRVPDADVRWAFYRTGLRIHDCEMLLERVDALVASEPQLLDPGNLDELITRLLQIAVEIPQLEAICEDLGIAATAIPAVATDWIAGRSIAELLEAHGADLRVTDTMQLAKCVEVVVAGDLPWVLSSAVELMRLRLDDDWDPSPELTALPAKAKHGLATASACFAASIGIRHRPTATALGAQFEAEGGGNFPQFVAWLSVVPPRFLRSLVGVSQYRLVADRAAMAATSREALQLLADGYGSLIATLITADLATTFDLARQLQPATDDTPRLTLRSVIDGPESNTIEVLANDEVIGVLDRSSARCIAPLLDTGATATIGVLTTSPSQITMLITITTAQETPI